MASADPDKPAKTRTGQLSTAAPMTATGQGIDAGVPEMESRCRVPSTSSGRPWRLQWIHPTLWSNGAYG
jgi:hypothetical protein